MNKDSKIYVSGHNGMVGSAPKIKFQELVKIMMKGDIKNNK
jgi:hypothetical protein